MQKWEYTCCSVTEASLNYEDLVKHLNKLGAEGLGTRRYLGTARHNGRPGSALRP
jgi:hypothetical protein